jgi:hypothetical protein
LILSAIGPFAAATRAVEIAAVWAIGLLLLCAHAC